MIWRFHGRKEAVLPGPTTMRTPDEPEQPLRVDRGNALPVKDAPTPTLASSAARGASVTLIGQLTRVGVQLGGLLVLARLLTPTEYGLIASIMAVVGIGDVLRDFGLSSAAIQAKVLTKGQSDNLFWLNSLFGLVIGLVIFFLSDPISDLFGNDSLQPLTQVLAGLFLLNGISTQYRAQLNRDLKFGSLAVSEVVGQVVGLGLAIALAIMSFGVWALVAQQVAAGGFTLILLGLQSKWQPGLPRKSESVTPFLKYGFHLMGAQILNYASQNVDSIIIGSRMGATQLGFYNRAFQLLTLPLSQINAPATRVALPVLARLSNEKERYQKFLLSGQSVLVHLVVGAFAFGCAQAPSLVPLALGSQWNAVTPLFQILSVAGAFQVCAYATYWVFLSKALTGSNLRFALVFRPIAILMIICGGFWGGVFGVAIAYAASALVGWLFGLVWISRASDAPALLMLANGSRALLGYGAAGAVSFLATSHVSNELVWLKLLLGLVALLLATAFVCLVWPRFRKDVFNLRSMARYLRTR